ncbi:MAG: NADH:ubiquinone reductase (Na(+)-transporting) subunit B, partial [bacterium]
MALRRFLDKIGPEFEPGGKFENWFALYEAVDTILYSPGNVTAGASHVRDAVEIKRIMTTVWWCAFFP